MQSEYQDGQVYTEKSTLQHSGKKAENSFINSSVLFLCTTQDK